MLARIHRRLCVGALATVGVIACAPATSSAVRESRSSSSMLPLTPTSRLIDAERIRRSGSHSALDAIRMLVPGYRSLDFRPLGTSRLDASSASRGSRRVMVDGHPIADVESLHMIPAREIMAIHVLSGPDAAIRFGPSFGGGAILIQTLGSLRPLE